jgi:glucose uptake protein GlcU
MTYLIWNYVTSAFVGVAALVLLILGVALARLIWRSK